METAVIYLGQDSTYEELPMVELNYIKDFEARVVGRGPNLVILDRTAFYAEGGGQPFDTGRLEWDGGSTKVYNVTKEGGEVRHHVRDLPAVDEVRGDIDWERRYMHSRMHTAQHLLSGLVFQGFGARTVSNSLGIPAGKPANISGNTLSGSYIYYSHVDFAPAAFSAEDLKAMETDFNEAVDAEVSVAIYEEDRKVLETQIAEDRAILELIPRSIRRLRVIQIGDRDLCPCGGTHVRNTSEIGHMRILRRRSKGKGVDRVTYELV